MSQNHIFKQIQSEPYRLFFPFGMILAVAGVTHWPLYAFGLIPKASAYFHSSIQTQAYLLCFVVGFLMTAMPRFASAASASGAEILMMFGLILANVIFLGLGQWIPAQICFLAVLAGLLLFAKKRIPVKRGIAVMPPLEFVWVPIAVMHGITGSLLILFNAWKKLPVNWFQAAKLLNEQGVILCIVIGIGGFLAPRLMGTFRVYAKPGQLPSDPALLKLRGAIFKTHLFAGILFFASFGLGAYFPRLSYALRAFILTAEYAWTCSFFRFPKTPDLYAKLLWVSLCLTAIGSWAAALFFQYRSAMLHILFIGGFSLMIFSVATMVVLSHGGAPERLRKPLPVLWAAAAGVFCSLGFRLAAGFFPDYYFQLLSFSGLIWAGAALYWFFFSLPVIFKVMSEEELIQSHESSKQRVAQLREGRSNPEGGRGDHSDAC